MRSDMRGPRGERCKGKIRKAAPRGVAEVSGFYHISVIASNRDRGVGSGRETGKTGRVKRARFSRREGVAGGRTGIQSAPRRGPGGYEGEVQESGRGDSGGTTSRGRSM